MLGLSKQLDFHRDSIMVIGFLYRKKAFANRIFFTGYVL